MHRLKRIVTVALSPVLICGWTAAHGSLPVPDGPEFKISTNVEYNKERVALAAHPDGRMIAAWSSNGQDGSSQGIFAQRYNADGGAAGGEFQVNVETFHNQAHPAVGVDGSGNFVIAWHSVGNTPNGIYARRYAANGTPLGGEFAVASVGGNSVRPLAVGVADGGEFVVLWERIVSVGNWVYDGQRFDAGGAPAGAVFQINEQAHSPQNEAASVAFLPDGGFLVAWGQNVGNQGDIRARRYDDEGQAAGSGFAISEPHGAVQGAPVLAFNTAGDGIVLWHRHADANPAFRSVHARRLNATGQPSGAQFRVNQVNERSQEYPAVAIDSNGNVLAVWASDRQDGTANWNVYARYLPANDTLCLPEFRVNSILEGHQVHPAVALASDGRALIGWQNNIPSTNPERILGQRYNPPATVFMDRFETCPADE